MANDRPTQGAATASRCPWCSTELPAAGSPNCPTCGATLVEPVSSVPGVNAPDAETISRAARAATPVRRSRIVSWITGDYDDSEDEVPAPPGSLAPPPPEVRREMARLAFQAEYANLEAEAGSIESEAKVEARAGSAQPPAEGSPQAAVPLAPSEAPGDDTGAPTQPD
jgi:hypothetical protein